MGHDDRERRRLYLQASILNPISNQLCAARKSQVRPFRPHTAAL